MHFLFSQIFNFFDLFHLIIYYELFLYVLNSNFNFFILLRFLVEIEKKN